MSYQVDENQKDTGINFGFVDFVTIKISVWFTRKITNIEIILGLSPFVEALKRKNQREIYMPEEILFEKQQK